MLDRAPRADIPAGGFADQRNEINVESLPIEGKVPTWLTGSLIRNGPAQWDLARGSVNHWFDGMAMLHRFAFTQGSVAYANRLLQSKAATAYQRTGRLSYKEFASDPCRRTFGRLAVAFNPRITDNAAVNVIRDGERWLALTESPMAVEFDPRTLATLGVRRLEPGNNVPVAHPHFDRDRKETLGLRVVFGLRSRYEVTVRDGQGRERLLGKIGVRHPAYQHSFAVTERYAIVGDHPLVVDPVRLVLSGKPFIDSYRWEPERGTVFTALDRVTGAVAGRWHAPASFCFHHVNAYDDGDSLVVDLVAFPDPAIVDALRLEPLRAGVPIPGAPITRHRLELGRPDSTLAPVAEAMVELPRVDERFAHRRYQRAYGVGPTDDASFFGRILAIGVDTGDVAEWRRPGQVPGEPVFVPRPGSITEGDGVVLTVVFEPELGASSMVILDGRTLDEIGRARVPQHVPFGFHGEYNPDS